MNTVVLRALVIVALFMVYTMAAIACEPPKGGAKISWRDVKLTQLFEKCRDTRGGPAQRKCEAEYFAFINTAWKK